MAYEKYLEKFIFEKKKKNLWRYVFNITLVLIAILDYI